MARIRRKVREVRLSYAVYLALSRLFRPGLFHYAAMYVLALDLKALAAQPSGSETVREIAAADLDDAPILGLPAAKIRDRLAMGDRFWLMEQNGRLLAIDWLTGQEKLIAPWLILDGSAGDIWGYFLKVSVEYRGRKLAPRLRRLVAQQCADEGYARLLSTLDIWNRNSLSFQLAVGAVPIGKFWFLTLLGVTLIRTGSRWRLGLWTAGRPLHVRAEETFPRGGLHKIGA